MNASVAVKRENRTEVMPQKAYRERSRPETLTLSNPMG